MSASRVQLDSCPFTENQARKVSERVHCVHVRVWGCMRVSAKLVCANTRSTTRRMEGPCICGQAAAPHSIPVYSPRTVPETMRGSEGVDG